ncbi:hypothetical protein GCM10008910_36200 [Faecalicatena orotica]|uniref:Uncharacterized protein n=1 Tax=Faecalicatena orotica TaxID=1544 RepID=A0A2Y9BC51_9FIRM|nr:hypothetical protein [Faecalicatena orotica]PWJ29755.1 hypothetical protein A8806_10555 [Faecalicatena orotica]SSA55479.1 hypothetical protein SAMN05216536_10555 [Faecalicatena orotica]
MNIGGAASHEDVVDACIKSGAITFIEKLEGVEKVYRLAGGQLELMEGQV